MSFDPRDFAREYEEQQKAGAKPNGVAPDQICLTPAAWAAREIPPEDKLLGPFSTTTRSQLSADTGLGKTMFGLAITFALRLQRDFLHWQVGEREQAPRLFYLDGEMPPELIKARLAAGASWFELEEPIPDGMFVLSHEDVENMPPLDTEAGARWLLDFMQQLGRLDFAVFDNIAALTTGELKEEQSAQTIKVLQREITGRRIGQLWLHHTGHDASRGYGSKMREWWLDTAMVAEKLDRPGADVAFTLKFPKCRRRTPDNRDEYEEMEVLLEQGQWSSSVPAVGSSKKRTLGSNARIVLDALTSAIADKPDTPPQARDIPPHTKGVTVERWREAAARYLPQSEIKYKNRAFDRAMLSLVASSLVHHVDGFAWHP